jgi:hypothetical protein
MTRIIPRAAGLFALAALALSLPAAARAEPPAVAGGHSCFGSLFGSQTCVWMKGPTRNPHIIQVPQPASDEDRARAAAREKRWVERCQPVILPDAFGVPRYVYAAAGCEFGRLD